MITGPAATVKLARKLRSELSLPEVVLWRELRKRPGGFKYRRQHPAGIYVLDFYCAAASLAIEIDGMAHYGIEPAKRDARRAEYLRSQHVATLRVPATVVLQDLEAAVVRIVEVCSNRVERACLEDGSAEPLAPLHHPADGPPPRAGEAL